MTDEKFIDKLNNYISKFGFIIDKNDMKNQHKYGFDLSDYVYLLVSKDSMSVRAVFKDIDELLNGSEFVGSMFDIFENWMEPIYTDVPKNKIEQYKSILSIKGKTKEEILLKLQIMGIDIFKKYDKIQSI